MGQIPREAERRAGHGIDPIGNQVIDPTKNVLDLVSAAIARQDDLRQAADKLTEVRVQSLKELEEVRTEALKAFETARHDSESRIQNWMRDTEMKRIAGLDTQRQFYETRIADMLRTSVESTSTLVSNQLVQIQSTFNDRVSQLERFRYETGGSSQGHRDSNTSLFAWFGAAAAGMIALVGFMSWLSAGNHTPVSQAPNIPPGYVLVPAPNHTP
jgi:flagellar biosynthesis GTPase FlhF